MARPKKADNERRDIIARTCINADEERAILEAVRQAGDNLSNWLRRVALAAAQEKITRHAA